MEPPEDARPPQDISQEVIQELVVTNIRHIRWEAESSARVQSCGIESRVTSKTQPEASSTGAAAPEPLPAAGPGTHLSTVSWAEQERPLSSGTEGVACTQEC